MEENLEPNNEVNNEYGTNSNNNLVSRVDKKNEMNQQLILFLIPKKNSP